MFTTYPIFYGFISLRSVTSFGSPFFKVSSGCDCETIKWQMSLTTLDTNKREYFFCQIFRKILSMQFSIFVYSRKIFRDFIAYNKGPQPRNFDINLF